MELLEVMKSECEALSPVVGKPVAGKPAVGKPAELSCGRAETVISSAVWLGVCWPNHSVAVESLADGWRVASWNVG